MNFIYSNEIKCAICSEIIKFEYSEDVWGNKFHTNHEEEGLFCHSCSRIISKGVTQGGFIYSDGRHLCSLCQATVVKSDNAIKKSLSKVILQLNEVGIILTSSDLLISIVELNELNKIFERSLESKLKGYTEINEIKKQSPKYNIYILNGLPKVEFEATLAHELLHVWLNKNSFNLEKKIEEGFCNLGSYLIYKNNNTKFSKIHIESMESNPSVIYGSGFRYMKKILIENSWKDLLVMLSSL